MQRQIRNEQGCSESTMRSVDDPVAMENVVVVVSTEVETVCGDDLVLETKMNAVDESELEREMQDSDETGKQSCVIDYECSSNSEAMLNCRICHLSADCRSEHSDLIQLGCGCKNDLGAAHRNCAEAWFQRKGDRCCEICGEAAKNIKGVEDAKFMDEWNEERVGENGAVVVSDVRDGCWHRHSFCNFLMGCLIIAFILPWLFRANLFP